MTTPETALRSTVVASPVGPLTLVASDAGLRAVLWPDERTGRVPLPDGVVAVGPADDPILATAHHELQEYFADGHRQFTVALDLRGTPFQLGVWTALSRVRPGTTCSYGDLAAAVGDRGKARAVGTAVGRNPVSIIVPCHRVVGSDGRLTGFAGGLDTKAWLLRHEGAAAPAAPTLPLG